MSRAIAKVAIESPLPQLDRLFDYEVPAELASVCTAGVRVLVPFGKSTKPYEGFVVSVSELRTGLAVNDAVTVFSRELHQQ